MSLLDRNTILNALDLPQEKVTVPEWGGDVLVRGLNGAELDAIQKEFHMDRPQEKDAQGNDLPFDTTGFRAALVEKCCINEDGRSLFKEGDAGLLQQKSAAALLRVFNVAQRLSGLGTEEAVTAAKNDSASPESASSTDLPSV